MEQLSGRVAVISGGASGIGRGMAEAFAAQGMKLVLADIEDAALAPAVAALKSGGAEVIGVRCDVTSPQSVADLAERALAQYGAVHVVCNNAGVAGASNVGALWELLEYGSDELLGTNMSLNYADTRGDIAADVLGLIEAENRPSLLRFCND
jgi:NAD(P)-dependent dehydrogenase (short-subunit alcohol dehydrogenase family)